MVVIGNLFLFLCLALCVAFNLKNPPSPLSASLDPPVGPRFYSPGSATLGEGESLLSHSPNRVPGLALIGPGWLCAHP